MFESYFYKYSNDDNITTRKPFLFSPNTCNWTSFAKHFAYVKSSNSSLRYSYKKKLAIQPPFPISLRRYSSHVYIRVFILRVSRIYSFTFETTNGNARFTFSSCWRPRWRCGNQKRLLVCLVFRLYTSRCDLFFGHYVIVGYIFSVG